jgi:hypothetical protein
MSSAKDYTVQRPTVAHVMVMRAYGLEPLPVLVLSRDGHRYGRMSVAQYIHFHELGKLP